MSAEVPKLHHRLLLGDPGPFGDRPTAEVIVVLADPAVLTPAPSFPSADGEPPRDYRAMAFPAFSRFEYV